MQSTLKVWTGLGLATALMGAGLAGCAGEAGEGEGGEGAEMAQAGEAGEGEAGEGGEGEGGEGEGGVAVTDAVSDPIVYGAALAIVDAHAIAARDAYAAGKSNAAAEMFAHPVSEVLVDMDPVFEQLGMDTDLKTIMQNASSEALKPDNADAVDAAYTALAGALESAAQKAPQNDRSQGAVAAGVVADQIDRAATMYREASSTEQYGPYLDGYGFYKAAAKAFARDGAQIEAYNSGLHSDIKAALELLGAAYPGAERPAELTSPPAQLFGASSKVNLGLPSN